MIDQTGHPVHLKQPARRVVSLVPSLTELLIEAGIQVVGRTKFCVHPADKVKAIQVVGGTKNFRFDAIEALQPDLIIGNKEENYAEGIEELRKRHPVYLSEIYSFEDQKAMMMDVGTMTDSHAQFSGILEQLERKWRKLKNACSGKAMYFIWRDPWMVAGTNTYIDHVLTHLGYQNIITGQRYPILDTESLAELSPETILLSSEPYPFAQKHVSELAEIFPKAVIKLVNGEPYSWYGTRLLHCDF